MFSNLPSNVQTKFLRLRPYLEELEKEDYLLLDEIEFVELVPPHLKILMLVFLRSVVNSEEIRTHKDINECKLDTNSFNMRSAKTFKEYNEFGTLVPENFLFYTNKSPYLSMNDTAPTSNEPYTKINSFPKNEDKLKCIPPEFIKKVIDLSKNLEDKAEQNMYQVNDKDSDDLHKSE